MPPKEIIANNEAMKQSINYLSYSQIETFETCPLHYKLKYILKVPTPPSASQSFGTAMHATLKEIYEQMPNDKKINDKKRNKSECGKNRLG